MQSFVNTVNNQKTNWIQYTIEPLLIHSKYIMKAQRILLRSDVENDRIGTYEGIKETARAFGRTPGKKHADGG